MPLTLEQHAQRRQGIGASEISAIVGLNPWSGPIDVYQAKVEVLERQSNAAIRRGDYLEPALREWYAYQLQRRVTIPDTMVHPDNPLVLATPDGISHGEGGPIYLEIKCPGYHTQRDWGADGSDQIPDYYIPQVTWGMAVAGLKVAHVVALVFNDMRIYTLQYDDELFCALQEQAMNFWHRHVLPQRPPKVDATEGFREWLGRRYQHGKKGSVLAESVAGNRLARALKAAIGQRDRADAKVLLAENKVKEMMGEHVEMQTAVGKITWANNNPSSKIDYRAVVESMGGASAEVLAKYTTVKPGPRVFKKDFRKRSDDDGTTPAPKKETK